MVERLVGKCRFRLDCWIFKVTVSWLETQQPILSSKRDDQIKMFQLKANYRNSQFLISNSEAVICTYDYVMSCTVYLICQHMLMNSSNASLVQPTLHTMTWGLLLEYNDRLYFLFIRETIQILNQIEAMVIIKLIPINFKILL